MNESRTIPTGVAGTAPVAPPRRPRFTQRFWLCVFIVVTLAGFAVAQPRILSLDNLRNVGVQASYMAIFAAAQAVVILTRGFDLALGTTVSLVSVLSALAMTHTGFGPAEAIAAGLAAGFAAGLLVGMANGALVAFGGINPFVATLGVTSVLASLNAAVSGGFPVAGLPDAFSALASSSPLHVPLALWIAAAVLLALHLMLSRTVFGRSLYIIGANPRAARAAGIPVRRTLSLAYVLCALLAALGALMLTARTGSGEPNLGGDLTLQTIAAAVLGGMRLRGGQGDIGAPVLGALFVTVLSNGMNLVQIDGFIQQICLGLIIIASLAVDRNPQAH